MIQKLLVKQLLIVLCIAAATVAGHAANFASTGSFKKVDENTYSFVMGTQDINVSGVQFIKSVECQIKKAG